MESISVSEAKKILQLSDDWTLKELKYAYRNLLRQTHPDLQESTATEEEQKVNSEKTVKLNLAYEVLLNYANAMATKGDEKLVKAKKEAKVTLSSILLADSESLSYYSNINRLVKEYKDKVDRATSLDILQNVMQSFYTRLKRFYSDILDRVIATYPDIDYSRNKLNYECSLSEFFKQVNCQIIICDLCTTYGITISQFYELDKKFSIIDDCMRKRGTKEELRNNLTEKFKKVISKYSTSEISDYTDEYTDNQVLLKRRNEIINIMKNVIDINIPEYVSILEPIVEDYSNVIYTAISLKEAEEILQEFRDAIKTRYIIILERIFKENPRLAKENFEINYECKLSEFLHQIKTLENISRFNKIMGEILDKYSYRDDFEFIKNDLESRVSNYKSEDLDYTEIANIICNEIDSCILRCDYIKKQADLFTKVKTLNSIDLYKRLLNGTNLYEMSYLDEIEKIVNGLISENYYEEQFKRINETIMGRVSKLGLSNYNPQVYIYLNKLIHILVLAKSGIIGYDTIKNLEVNDIMNMDFANKFVRFATNDTTNSDKFILNSDYIYLNLEDGCEDPFMVLVNRDGEASMCSFDSKFTKIPIEKLENAHLDKYISLKKFLLNAQPVYTTIKENGEEVNVLYKYLDYILVSKNDKMYIEKKKIDLSATKENGYDEFLQVVTERLEKMLSDNYYSSSIKI